jgi:hypothetical protein
VGTQKSQAQFGLGADAGENATVDEDAGGGEDVGVDEVGVGAAAGGGGGLLSVVRGGDGGRSPPPKRDGDMASAATGHDRRYPGAGSEVMR